jgi:SNF2 family DNA or RNA helicase
MSEPAFSDDEFDAWLKDLTGDSVLDQPVEDNETETDITTNDLEPEPEPEPEIDFEFESEKLLREMEAELNAVEESFKDEKVQLTAIEEEEKELRLKLQELAERKRQFSEKTFDIRRRIRRMREYDIPAQEQRVRIDKANAEQKAKQEAERLQFEKMTEDAKWRDRAMAHQLDGAIFMASAKRAIIADSMGLGKTLQSLMALDMLQAKKILIISPGEVMTNFVNEAKRWAPHRSVMVIGRQPKATQQMMIDTFSKVSDEFTFVLNYESWYRNRNLLVWLQDVGFDTVIIDEAHAVKELSGLPYKGVSEIILCNNKCSGCGKLIPSDSKTGERYCQTCWRHADTASVENFFAMTGTPILNRPTEIYPLLHLARPDIFQTKYNFKAQFCTTDYNGDEVWRTGGQESLARRISGMYIRRTLDSAGIKLPPQDKVIHEIELDEETYKLQAEILEILRKDAQIRIVDGRAAKVTDVLTLILRQRQATVWPGGIWMNVPVMDELGQPVYTYNEETDQYEQVMERVHIGKDYQQSVKLDRAVELYHELVDGGHRVVFFSQFKEALYEMKKRLGDRVVEYHGDVPQYKRDEIKRNFDRAVGETPKWDGILCQYQMGGVGLNLTAATAIIVLDEEWNEGKEQQAFDRIHRLGQTEQTQVHILRHVGPGHSIDNWLAELIQKKGDIVAGFNYSVDMLKGAFD